MTAKSGYIQRRIIKVCEDIQVKYDGSVRDTTGKIYQLAYGDTGMDPCSTVKVDNKQQACDIFRIVDRLNLVFELKEEKVEKVKEEKVEKVKEKVKDKKEKVEKVKEKKEKVKEEKVEKKEEIIYTRRIDILRAMEKVTGKKSVYKGISDEELIKRLENM
jgi:hypothetical protein